MEQFHNEGNHRLNLINRENGSLTGVKDVISFDSEDIILALEGKKLTIHGDGLQITRLSVEKGELDFTGEVESMMYSESKTGKQRAAGLLGRMFK